MASLRLIGSNISKRTRNHSYNPSLRQLVGRPTVVAEAKLEEPSTLRNTYVHVLVGLLTYPSLWVSKPSSTDSDGQVRYSGDKVRRFMMGA